eukprot:m.467718 g.467718  ORF g.467718 m.467718 type:complete len:92 (+) comp57064_c0_seq30:3675-3950(+)
MDDLLADILSLVLDGLERVGGVAHVFGFEFVRLVASNRTCSRFLATHASPASMSSIFFALRAANAYELIPPLVVDLQAAVVLLLAPVVAAD